jgi:hypothetical protein
VGVGEKGDTDNAVSASGKDWAKLQSPYVQKDVRVEFASGWAGCGAYHEVRWMGELRYGAEVYEECEV